MRLIYPWVGGLWLALWIGVGRLWGQAAAEAPPTTHPQPWRIADIDIEGLRHTREAVVRRELPFAVGDTLAEADLETRLREGERQLMNTGLFRSAALEALPDSAGALAVKVRLREGWYVYPVPIFELADRNFNVWWVEQGRSLDRLNVGMEFLHENFSGWRDRLKLGFKYGYTRSLNLSYRFPYLNRERTLGISFDLNLARNRELNYATEADKQLFFRDESTFVYRRGRVAAGLSYRRWLYTTHQLIAAWHFNAVDERVALELNPNFLGGGRAQQRYLTLIYGFSCDRRDVRPYPWSGYLLAATLEADGLGLFADRNDLTLYTRAERYWPWGRHWSAGLELRTKLSAIRRPQPYNDNRALGFGGSYVNGYEYYIIDGLDMALLKSAVRRKLIDKSINLGRLMPLETLKVIPIKAYLGLTGDWGYVNAPFADPANRLPNRSLWGGGASLDLVFFYDTVLQLQYSRNDLGEGGFFLHFSFGI